MDNKKKNPNVPNLRFNYSDRWIEKSLQNICEFYKGNGISKEDISENGNPCILYGQLYTTYKNEIIHEVISKTNVKLKNPFYSKINDLIIPSSGEDPLDIAVARSVKQENVLLGGDLNVLRPNKEVSSDFLSYQLNGVRKYDIAKIAQGKSIVHLHNEDLKKIKVYIPSIQEQMKISSLLNLLDIRIDTQNKIIKEYHAYKNAIIDELIFKNPDLKIKVPLREFAVLKNGYAFKSDTYDDNGQYNIITIANVSGGKYINASLTNKIISLPKDIQDHQILQHGDILISLTGNVGRVSIVDVDNCLLNQRVGVLSFKDTYMKDYIYQVLSSNKFENKMIQKGQGAAQKNISNEDVETFLITVSLDENNCRLIAQYLNLLDEKIAIETNLLNDYILEKKYLLNNMFV